MLRFPPFGWRGQRLACLALSVAQAAALGGSACTPDFDDIWLVKDLRILAIRARPPERFADTDAWRRGDRQAAVQSIEPVTIEPLVVDPREPSAAVRWEAQACTAEADRCDEAARSEPVADGVTPLAEIRFDFLPTLELLGAGLRADPLRGFGGLPLLIEIRIDDGDFVVRGQRRIVYQLLPTVASDPNNNPAITLLTADDRPLGERWREERLGEPARLEPRTSPASLEQYVVPTFDGESRELEEFLSYSYFVTSGELSHGRTGGQPSSFFDNTKISDISSTWTPPVTEAGERAKGTLWVVTRDDRGGVDWVTVDYDVAYRPGE